MAVGVVRSGYMKAEPTRADGRLTVGWQRKGLWREQAKGWCDQCLSRERAEGAGKQTPAVKHTAVHHAARTPSTYGGAECSRNPGAQGRPESGASAHRRLESPDVSSASEEKRKGPRAKPSDPPTLRGREREGHPVEAADGAARGWRKQEEVEARKLSLKMGVRPARCASVTEH